MLRLSGTRRILHAEPSECIKKNNFRHRYVPFWEGVDCECEPQTGVVETPVDVWAARYPKLPKTADNKYPVVCSKCGQADKKGKHNPEKM